MKGPMNNRKVVVIGGGIAGLCAAVYARKCGYNTMLLEQQQSVGGLATHWRRGDYTFETCLHWLMGSGPETPMHARWQEVFDIDELTFVYPEKFVHIESTGGEHLDIYTDTDRMETALVAAAPGDAAAIRHFTTDIRRLARVKMPDFEESWPHNWLSALHMVPYLPLLRRWSSVTTAQYGRQFTHPLLQAFFGSGDLAQLSAITLAFSLVWMGRHDAGYPLGGSRAVIEPIAANLQRLGGELRLGAKVEKILVEHDAAVGVRLASGEVIEADWVISAADGHSTLYDLLSGAYVDHGTDETYKRLKTFPSYLQVSLGVGRDLSSQDGYVIRVLDTPLQVDPVTRLTQLPFRIFNFDPTFAPAGKTPVTCFLETSNFGYWLDLQRRDPAMYQAEKDRIAQAVIDTLERSVPGVRADIETIDVSTPATVVNYTGNWKGSMEGWLLAPGRAPGPLPHTLPGLKQFMMAGQWVMPGGGLPSGLMTARTAIRDLCKRDGVPFLAGNASAQSQRAA